MPAEGTPRATLSGLELVWSPRCESHRPAAEVWVGVPTPAVEGPERVETIRRALLAAGARPREAAEQDDAVLRVVHDAGLLDYLRRAHRDWVTAGLTETPGQAQVVPYVFPTPGLLEGMPLREATAVAAQAGRWCYDTMTLVGPGTWEAARAATDVAQAGAQLLLDGARLVYALTRPPGHHATRSAFGGSCYLNNAAVAAEVLRRGGVSRVAIVDIDAHPGNGTQSIFYDRGDVLYASVHVDPGAGWFPHYLGFADEQGLGAGLDATLNLPLAPGAGDAEWLHAVRLIRSVVQSFSPGAVVVSLGVDAAVDDPESPLRVSEEGYRETGRALAGIAPVLAVQEGGYHLPSLGRLVVATLAGLAG